MEARTKKAISLRLDVDNVSHISRIMKYFDARSVNQAINLAVKNYATTLDSIPLHKTVKDLHDDISSLIVRQNFTTELLVENYRRLLLATNAEMSRITKDEGIERNYRKVADLYLAESEMNAARRTVSGVDRYLSAVLEVSSVPDNPSHAMPKRPSHV